VDVDGRRASASGGSCGAARLPATGGRDGRNGNISRVVADCEQRTNQFRVSLRAALDRSALNGSRREDQLNVDAERLERAMNRVREAWNREQDPPKTRHFVDEAIAAPAGH